VAAATVVGGCNRGAIKKMSDPHSHTKDEKKEREKNTKKNETGGICPGG
jgi:hypothetical protein